MPTKWLVSSLLILLIFLSGFSSVSASSPALGVAAGIVSNVVSTVFKWLWSQRTLVRTEKVVSSRSLMKFEGGYNVETVFDGSKIGIEPYLVEASPTGELLILDSINSNLYKISSPLSRFSRPKLVAGSAEGYTGHVDGKLREARMYHPRGITADDNGNIYIADTANMAIRKISDSGVTTIAGGKWSHGGSHIDGPSEDAKFSDDFDVVYVRSSCSILVIDRGNQAIREIQLQEVDCTYDHPVQHEEHDDNYPLGVAVLIAAVFFGYMLALLKQSVQALFSSKSNIRVAQYPNHAITAQTQRPMKSFRPPIIPVENEEIYEKDDEGLIFSFGRLILNASSSMAEIFAGLLFAGFKRKKQRQQNPPHYQHLSRHPNHGWPVQDSYIIRDEDEAPGLETRTPIMTKTYPLINRESDNTQHHQFRQSQGGYYAEQDQINKQQKQQKPQQQQLNSQKHGLSNVKTGHDQMGPETSEIVFGAVQDQDGRREAMVIKAVDFSDPSYNHHNIRPRVNYMGYSSYSY